MLTIINISLFVSHTISKKSGKHNFLSTASRNFKGVHLKNLIFFRLSRQPEICQQCKQFLYVYLPDRLTIKFFVTKIFTAITISICGLCIGCALKEDPDINNAGRNIEKYEKGIEEEAHKLNRSGRLIFPGLNMRNMTWIMGWDHNGSILLEISTSHKDYVYSFANAVRDRQRSLILASEQDLDNPSQFSRVLQIDHNQVDSSQGEIEGKVLRVDRRTLTEIKEATTSQTVLRDITTEAQIEAFFQLVFARAMHRYTHDLTIGRAQEFIDELMHERKAYIGRSSVYWKKENNRFSLNEDTASNHRNNFEQSHYDNLRSYTANNNLNSILEGDVNVNVDLVSFTDNDPRIINIFFQQSAKSFKDLQQTRGINVILGTDSEQLDIAEYGSIYLKSKNLDPFRLVFGLSASSFGISANLDLEIFNLTHIDLFQRADDLQMVGGNISRIARRRNNGFTKTVKTIGNILKSPFDGLKWLGRFLTGKR